MKNELYLYADRGPDKIPLRHNPPLLKLLFLFFFCKQLSLQDLSHTMIHAQAPTEALARKVV